MSFKRTEFHPETDPGSLRFHDYWFKVKRIPVKKLDWKWNALYTAVDDIKEAYGICSDYIKKYK